MKLIDVALWELQTQPDVSAAYCHVELRCMVLCLRPEDQAVAGETTTLVAKGFQ